MFRSLYAVNREAFRKIAEHLLDLGLNVNEILIGVDDIAVDKVRLQLSPILPETELRKRWNGYSETMAIESLQDVNSMDIESVLTEVTKSLKDAFTDGVFYCERCAQDTRHQRINWVKDMVGDYIVLGKCLECPQTLFWYEVERKI